ISGGIDISVGSIMGLAALGCAAALLKLPDDARTTKVLLVGIGVPVLIGLLCGCINGALVVGLRMHPFIVTLATLSIFRGIALVNVKEGSLPAGDKLLQPEFTDHFIAFKTTISTATQHWKAPLSAISSAWNRWIKQPTKLEPVPMVIMFLV